MKKLKAEAWLRLPNDVMYLIMSKLMVLPVYLARFSAVCKPWHQLVSDAWPVLIHQHQTTPMALVPVVKEEGKVDIYNLRGEYINSLPRGFTRIIGSSFGWLILNNMTNNSVSLFNPLSNSHIRLPPFSPEYQQYLVKGVLSKPPPSRPELQDDAHFDIAITMCPAYLNSCKAAINMALLHVGGNYTAGELESMQWVYHSDCNILDVNSIRGRICILDSTGSIRCWNHHYSVKSLPSWVFNVGAYFATTAYLLESSSSSEPLVVFRYKDNKCSGWPTVGFKILALKMKKTWTEIETLDNDVLFLSDKASICIQDANYKLRAASNSFYFPDEYKYDPRGNYDFGVFNVDRNGVTQFPICPDVTKFRPKPPIWLQVPSYDEILKFSSLSKNLI